MIIITGIGRCGTSFMAKFLKECGQDIGAKKWFNPINAGYENRETLSINARLISNLIKGEEINPYEIKADIYRLDFDVVKDPQLLTDARILKEWWEVRQDLQIIFLYRNPQDIVNSMKQVPEWNSPVYRLFPEMIEEKNKEFLDMVNLLKIPIKKFKFPDLLIKGDQVIEELSEWIELPDDAFDIWKNLVE